MKKQLALFVLAGTGAACQPQTTASTSSPAAPEALVGTVPSASPAKPVQAPGAIADSLTLEMRATLRQVNLANLFLAPEPGHAGDYQSVLDGFFGNNPQRLSLAILKATRDSLNPELYNVIGKTRYKQQICRFAGQIKLTKLADYYDQGMLLSQGGDDLEYVQDTTRSDGGSIVNASAYSARASFHFRTATPTPEVLTGQVLVDFWVNDKGKLGSMNTPFEGQILRGYRQKETLCTFGP